MRIKFSLTIASITFFFLIMPQASRGQDRVRDTLAPEAQSKANDNKQSLTPSVDQELEVAAKRGEKVLDICLQDCDKSSNESSADVETGRALRLPKPTYPVSARLERASGLVDVKVLINEAGEVIAADAISGHPSLRNVCVEAARESLFSPTRLDGHPVKVTGVIRYNFVR